MSKDNNKKLKEALLNKALGYTTQEVVEEYGYSGDEFVLQKRKTSTKSYPPDFFFLRISSALKGYSNSLIVLFLSSNSFSCLSYQPHNKTT